MVPRTADGAEGSRRCRGQPTVPRTADGAGPEDANGAQKSLKRERSPQNHSKKSEVRCRPVRRGRPDARSGAAHVGACTPFGDWELKPPFGDWEKESPFTDWEKGFNHESFDCVWPRFEAYKSYADGKGPGRTEDSQLCHKAPLVRN
jgi:hypothetical protein